MDHSPVLAAPRAVKISGASKTIHALDNGVLSDAKLFGQGLNRGFPSGWHPPNGKEELVLLRLEFQSARGFLAGSQKQTDAVTEFRECSVIRLGNLRNHSQHLNR